MGFLKFVFVLLLVVPVAVLMLYFVSNLSDKMKTLMKNQKNNAGYSDRKASQNVSANGSEEKRQQLRGIFTRKKKTGGEKSSGGKKRSGKDGRKDTVPERRAGERDVYGSSSASASKDYLKDTPYYRKKQEMKAAQGGRAEHGSFGASDPSGSYAGSYSDRGHKADAQKGMSKRQRRKARKSKKKVRESQK